MKNNLLDTIILTIIIFGILMLGQLSYRELLYGGFCSKTTIVPDCYVVFFYYFILFFFQIFKKLDIWFIILAGFALIFSLFASIEHFIGDINYPVPEIGVPSCYLAATSFFVLLVLKFVQIKVERRT